MSKGTARVQTLGTCQGAEADLVALTKLHVSTELLEAFVGILITRVNDPSVCLHKDSGTKVVLRMPPVAGASALATGAKDALVQTIEELAVLNGLDVLALPFRLLGLALEERVN